MHDYDEVVYVIEGQSTWTVNGQERAARAGDVLVVHAGEPHKFVNSGDGSPTPDRYPSESGV